MTSAVNSFLRHFAQAPIRFASVKGYSTTTKKVTALVYSEENNNSTKRTVYLPSSRLLISKTGKLSPQFEATHVKWCGNQQHYLSGLPYNFDYDEEFDSIICTELKKAVVIPAEQESRINDLVNKIHVLEMTKRIIQTDIDVTLAKIDDECEKLGDLFK